MVTRGLLLQVLKELESKFFLIYLLCRLVQENKHVLLFFSPHNVDNKGQGKVVKVPLAQLPDKGVEKFGQKICGACLMTKSKKISAVLGMTHACLYFQVLVKKV